MKRSQQHLKHPHTPWKWLKKCRKALGTMVIMENVCAPLLPPNGKTLEKLNKKLIKSSLSVIYIYIYIYHCVFRQQSLFYASFVKNDWQVAVVKFLYNFSCVVIIFFSIQDINYIKILQMFYISKRFRLYF